MDIQAAVWTTAILLWVFSLLTFLTGVRVWALARRLTFFRLRRERMRTASRLVLLALALAGLGWWTFRFGEPTVYRFYPPTPSITPTPTVTATPTPITPTLTPTVTNTPSETYTPTATSTPFIPPQVATLFTGTLTPPPEPRFSKLTFTTRLNFRTYQPLDPGEVFHNPVGQMYGVFSYDGMADGVQWTALWFRDGELVHFETKPWDGGTGGYGYTEWIPDDPKVWQPGTYTVYIFVGEKLVTQGSFQVEGLPPSPTATATSTATLTPTITPSPTRTPFGGGEATPTSTPSTPTPSPSPTSTP